MRGTGTEKREKKGKGTIEREQQQVVEAFDRDYLTD